MSINILLADHQPKVRSAVRFLLEQQVKPCVIEEVSTMQDMLEVIENRCPEVLLLDWKLPVSSPERLIENLNSLFPRLYIIATDSDPQTEKLALKAGANSFISKNDPPECLLAAIERYRDSGKKNCNAK